MAFAPNFDKHLKRVLAAKAPEYEWKTGCIGSASCVIARADAQNQQLAGIVLMAISEPPRRCCTPHHPAISLRTHFGTHFTRS